MAKKPKSFEEAQNDPNWCNVCGEYHNSVKTVKSHGRAAEKFESKYNTSI
jgi:hypothetical protein